MYVLQYLITALSFIRLVKIFLCTLFIISEKKFLKIYIDLLNCFSSYKAVFDSSRRNTESYCIDELVLSKEISNIQWNIAWLFKLGSAKNITFLCLYYISINLDLFSHCCYLFSSQCFKCCPFRTSSGISSILESWNFYMIRELRCSSQSIMIKRNKEITPSKPSNSISECVSIPVMNCYVQNNESLLVIDTFNRLHFAMWLPLTWGSQIQSLSHWGNVASLCFFL